jgi:hypothetical protein
MDDMLSCPVCKTIQSKSTVRYIDGSRCCVNCKDFVKASRPSLDSLFDASQITKRRNMNPRFPGAEAGLVKQLIVEGGLQGTHVGQGVVSALSALREKLEHELSHRISKYERYSLIFRVFQTLDLIYGQDLERTQKLANAGDTQSIPDITKGHYKAETFVGTVGKGLERILEIAIANDSRGGEYVRNENNPIWLSEIATEMAMINGAIESYVYLCDKRGKLNIDTEDWQLELTEEDRKRLDNIRLNWSEDDVRHIRMNFDVSLEGPSPEEWMQSLKEIIKGSTAEATQKLGFDIVEFLQTIDDTHRVEFQHTFSEKLLVLLCLIPLSTELVRKWAFEEEIVNYLDREAQIPKGTLAAVLGHLSLTKEDLLQENAYPFEFRRKFRLIRRPLPRLDIGAQRVYLLSIPLIGRHFLNVMSDYMDGTDPVLENTETNKLIDRLKQQYSDYFVREHIYQKLIEQGYIARYHIEQIGSHVLKLECGEIDILIVGKARNKLIVGEGKHMVNNCVSIHDMRQEKTAYVRDKTGYAAKLRGKLQWVEDHKREVLDFMDVQDLSDNIPCTPVFLTNIYTPATEYIDDISFITVYDNEPWWHKLD